MKRNQGGVETRSALLDAAATAAGASWAEGWFEDLRREHRRVSGGWPGTMTEARARAVAFLGAELSRRDMLALTYDERERVARVTYAKAKREWLQRGEREQPEPEP